MKVYGREDEGRALAVGDLLSAAGSRALMEVISIPCKLIYVGEGWGSRPDMCKAQQNSVF